MAEMSVEDRAKVFSALSDPTRLRIVEILASEEELCGTNIARRAGISLALLSHHWKVLSDAGVVVRERRGQSQYCKVDPEVLKGAFEFVWQRSRLRSSIT